MLEFFARRVLWIIPVLLTVATVTFFLMHRAPGGPWDREQPIPAATQAALNAKFGLDKPLWFNPQRVGPGAGRGQATRWCGAARFLDSQFFNYIFGAARGDLGPSYQSKGTETVQQVIAAKIPVFAQDRPGGDRLRAAGRHAARHHRRAQAELLARLSQPRAGDHRHLGADLCHRRAADHFHEPGLQCLAGAAARGMARRSARPIICPASCSASARWRLSRA